MSNQTESVNLSLFSGSDDTTAIHKSRLLNLFDGDSFTEIDNLFGTGEYRGVDTLICGYGMVHGKLVYAFSQNGEIRGHHSRKLTRLYELAITSSSPVVGIYDSKGMDLSLGVKILDSCGEILLKQATLSGLVPQISIVLGACIGTNAILASGADFIVMSETGSFFTAPLYNGNSVEIGTAKAAGAQGVAHITTETEDDALVSARRIIQLTCNEQIGYEINKNYWETLSQLALEETLNGKEIVRTIFDAESLLTFFDDFGQNVLVGMATLNGKPLGVIASLSQVLEADDCEKIGKISSYFASFNLPIISLINTVGLSESAPFASHSIVSLTNAFIKGNVPKVTIIIGKAYGSGYVAFASPSSKNDYVAAWPNAIISPLPPNSAVAFLKGDLISTDNPRELLEEDYIQNEASPIHMARLGIIDTVIEPENSRDYIIKRLSSLGW